PDVLVTRDESKRGRNRKVIKDFGSLFIASSAFASAKLHYVPFQCATDSVVVKARSKTVVFATRGQAVGKERNARIPSDRIGLLRCITYSSKDSDSPKRLAATEFLSNLRSPILHKQILGEVADCDPAVRLIVDRQALHGAAT